MRKKRKLVLFLSILACASSQAMKKIILFKDIAPDNHLKFYGTNQDKKHAHKAQMALDMLHNLGDPETFISYKDDVSKKRKSVFIYTIKWDPKITSKLPLIIEEYVYSTNNNRPFSGSAPDEYIKHYLAHYIHGKKIKKEDFENVIKKILPKEKTIKFNFKN